MIRKAVEEPNYMPTASRWYNLLAKSLMLSLDRNSKRKFWHFATRSHPVRQKRMSPLFLPRLRCLSSQRPQEVSVSACHPEGITFSFPQLPTHTQRTSQMHLIFNANVAPTMTISAAFRKLSMQKLISPCAFEPNHPSVSRGFADPLHEAFSMTQVKVQRPSCKMLRFTISFWPYRHTP